MKIISRYVLGELLQVFLVSLTALTMFMLIVGLVKEAQQQGLGLVQIAMLVPYVLPEAMRFAVPGTMLFAVASVFGRMSASNEITALKAAGITPMAAIWPAVGLAVAVSLVSVWLNDVAVSWGRDGIRRVIVGSVEEIIYGRLRQTRAYTTRQLSINVKGVDGKKLIRPTLSFQPGGSTPPVTVSAAEAEMRADAKAETLTITRRTPSRPHDTAMSLSHTETKLTTTARPMAGQIAAIGVMPAALRAVISLPADIRPKTLATAKSIVPGTANRIASGKT